MNSDTISALGGRLDERWLPPPPEWSAETKIALGVAGALLGLFLLVRFVSAVNRGLVRLKYGVAKGAVVVGFLHPYCDAGGGGERVLWQAVHALAALSRSKKRPIHVLIYTGDRGAAPDAIFRRVEERFGIAAAAADLPVELVYLRARPLLSARLYPLATVLGQSLGSVFLGIEALCRATPDVFFDSTGLAFTYPAAWLAGCRVGAYIHYPTVSSDMVARVTSGRAAHNHRSLIASNPLLTLLKVIYYKILMLVYGFCGGFATVVAVNSTWTRKHVAALFWGSRRAPPTVVFPPCDAASLRGLPLARRPEAALTMVSVGQFRPEKDHLLQIEVLREVRTRAPELAGARLVIVGGCRGAEDEGLVKRLHARAAASGLGEDAVEFVVNCGFSELRKRLAAASVGLHTMRDEHFGIGVVEMMATGLVVVAHNSGGPQSDIVMPFRGVVTGMLAETVEEYAERVEAVLLPEKGEDWPKVRAAARDSTSRFSNAEFDRRFAVAFEPLLDWRQ